MLAAHEPCTNVRQQAFERLLSDIEDGSARCGVIGLGFIGSVLMDALLDAGFEARGFDRAESAVARFRQHRAASASNPPRVFSAGHTEAELSECDVLFVAVRNPVESGVIDEEPLHAAGRMLRRQAARARARPRLVILESTVTPGTTRRFAAEIAAGDEELQFVVHAPERLSAGHDHTVLRATPHLVAGMDEEALQLGLAMLQRICNEVIPVSSPEVSELSKLLENAFLSVNIGLINEITRLSLHLGIRAQEVCRAAATKPQGFMPFHPGAGVGGHCLPNDLQMLAATARAHGWDPELLSGAVAVNERAPRIVVDRLEKLLANSGMRLTAATVLIVGVGFKTGSPDITRSPAIEIVAALRQRGAAPCYCDSLVENFSVDGAGVLQIAATDVHQRQFTAAIILAGDAALPEASLQAACTVVLDAGGSRQRIPPRKGIETL